MKIIWEIDFFEKDVFYFKIEFPCVSLCGYVHIVKLPIEARRGRWSYSLQWVPWWECWELNLGPLKEPLSHLSRPRKWIILKTIQLQDVIPVHKVKRIYSRQVNDFFVLSSAHELTNREKNKSPCWENVGTLALSRSDLKHPTEALPGEFQGFHPRSLPGLHHIG